MLSLAAGTWAYDPQHSSIAFVVRHAGIATVRGVFTDIKASMVVDEKTATSSADIRVASLATGSDDRDYHLRSEDFFNAEEFPHITFRSNSFELDGDQITIRGHLVIKETSRPIELTGIYGGIVVDPFGTTRAGFSLRGTISRKDYGIVWNAALEAGGVLVSDKVNIEIEAEFIAPESQ